MWNSLLSQGISSIGVTPLHLAQIQGVIIANQLFLKGMEKTDIYVTKKLFGVEESMKSEQDWYYIKSKTQPVFDFLNFGLNSVTSNEQSSVEQSNVDGLPIGQFNVPDTKLVYTKSGNV